MVLPHSQWPKDGAWDLQQWRSPSGCPGRITPTPGELEPPIEHPCVTRKVSREEIAAIKRERALQSARWRAQLWGEEYA